MPAAPNYPRSVLLATDRRKAKANYNTHSVPNAGTLNEISYCSSCGAGFSSCGENECPKTKKR